MLLEDTVKAVDFSYWNTHTNPPPIAALQAAGVRCCMVRFGKGKNTEGTDLGVDRAIQRNVQAIADHGMHYMPYWRIFNLEESNPIAQAQQFVAELTRFNYNAFRAPVWIDCEEWQFDALDQHLHPDMVAHWIHAFSNALRYEGWLNQGIYTRANWWGSMVSPIGVMNGYPLWVAHWPGATGRERFKNLANYAQTWDEFADQELPLGPAIPSPWVDWDAWQFIGEGSGAGTIFGFDSEHLDCNLIKRSSYNRWFG